MASIIEMKQAVENLIASTTELPKRTRLRLAFLVFGVLLSGSIVLRRIATTSALVDTSATHPASHERRLRRTLQDCQLTWAATYKLTVSRVLRHPTRGPWVVILDETGHTEIVRTLVAALWYRGRALPLAWVVWTGQVPHEQAYWTDTAVLLEQVAQILPQASRVRVVADRAFGCPAFTDLVAAKGWEWVVRVQGQTRFHQAAVQECRLDSLAAQPGQHWSGTGQIFKKAGWRQAQVLCYWGKGHKGPLLLVSNGPGGLALCQYYRQRSAIEALFRDWKSSGWEWEASQVRASQRQAQLILAMAYATLITLCLGEERAEQITKQPKQAGGRRPWAARDSLFQLGRQRFWERLWKEQTRTIVWELAHQDAPNWSQECWLAAHPEDVQLWMTGRVGKREKRRAA